MLKNLSDNLNILMAKARLSCNELANKTGIPAGTIKRIKNNNTNPTIETLLPIARYFSIAISELVGDAPLNATVAFGIKKIPLLNWNDCSFSKDLNLALATADVLTERQVSDQCFALIIRHDDIDFFPKNAIIIVEPEKQPESGDYVVVSKENKQTATVRKYVCDIDRIYLKSLINSAETTVLDGTCRIMGVIVQYKINLSTDVSRAAP